LITPASAGLSSGLVCFEVSDKDPGDVVKRLYDRWRVVASVTPYSTRYVRLGPSMLNTPQHIEYVLRAVRATV
jgi:selenocysteine lyase/cysteine desulfurase